MTETPREYKKRIDEKRVHNSKNKNKLIKKIDEYELLDKSYRENVKNQILESFSRNEKAEQESEQYITIISELSKIDQKYKELSQMKENLKSKKEEKKQTDKEIREIKLDGVDETTLTMQMAGVRELKEKLRILNSEIEELEKDIQNMEAELKEIEEIYGEVPKDNEPIQTLPEKISKSTQNKSQAATPTTLKEYHEQTINDLWDKDSIRGEIFQLLDKGTGIDDELVDEIKKEITNRFWEYYDENQGNLRMKSARYIKNKLKNKKNEYKEILEMPDGPERQEKIAKFDELLKAYPLSEFIKSMESVRLNESKEATKRLLKKYRDARDQKVSIGDTNKAKIIKASQEIPVKIEIDKDGSRLIELMVGNKIYKILDPILDRHTSAKYETTGNRTDMILPKRMSAVYGDGMIGNNVDKWKNRLLRGYVKQKESEGLHIAKTSEIEELLNELGNMAKIDNETDKRAMLMYLTGMDGAYWLANIEGDKRSGVFFVKEGSFYKLCGEDHRLNHLLMMSVTEL